ncbi:cytochrome c [Flavobacterium sp.]|uniref:c-type cytochrome n=1 Tax=Flavobacterium sp. TaxID=239 RepID=UPI0026101878|nr:cytochrome c [Flavobacterium sp.]
MKLKIVALAIVGILLYSCAPKFASTTAAKNVVLTPALAEGKNLFESNCAKCHGLPPVTQHTKEDWIPVLDRMAKKAKVTDEQKASIYNYITASL